MSGDSGYFHLARLGFGGMFEGRRARDENSGMTRFFSGGILFHALAGVDRSGRGCNPRPACWGRSRDDGEVGGGFEIAKRRLARRIPKRRLGTTGFRGAWVTGGCGRIEVAKRHLAGRIPKRRLGTTGFLAALG